MTRRVVVVGGGIGGCAAAMDLARAGCDVVLLERAPNLGGLVVSFSVGGTALECFYHHIFPNESEIIRLIGELGLGDRLRWHPSSISVLTEGKFWPFTSTTDLLRFSPLPPWDRVRLGSSSLWLTTKRDSRSLDDIPARDWLRSRSGERSMRVIWDPLLKFKFGAAAADVPLAWVWGRFRQRASARSFRGERLGYLRGGFRQLFDSLSDELLRMGVRVETEASVEKLEVESSRVRGVVVDNEQIEADAVVYAGQLPNLASLVPESLDARWALTGRLGAICVVLELDRPISKYYWTNCCDADLPFGALIEHTNLVPSSEYGGRHVAYLGRYFTADDPVARADLSVLSKEWIDALAAYLPTFDAGSVIAVHPFRTPYAAPLVQLGYRNLISPVRSHVDGLYVATTAQIYPQDRGMNEGIKLANRAARRLLDRPENAMHEGVWDGGSD